MSGWKTAKLGECAQLVNGRAYSQHELLDTGTPVIRIQNLNGGERWYYSNLKLPEEKYCNSGDLLFAWSASFGPYIWRGEKSIFHYHIWRVVPFDNLDKGYAFHLLGWITEKVKAASHGVAMLHMTKAGMESWEVPLPPLPEQRRIAAILDQADALRAKRRETLAQLDRLTQAIFVEMFGDPVSNPKGWPVTTLTGLVERIQIGPFGSQLHEEDYIEDGVPLVNPTHIKGGQIYPDRTLTVPDRKYQQLPQYHLSEGDLVLGRRGEMGRCAVVTAAEHGWLCGTGSLFVRPNKQRLNPVYLGQVIASDSMRKYLQNAAQGVTMPNLNKDIVGSIPVPVPSLPQQERFADALVANQGLRNVAVRASLELDTLFTSLQHRAFAGEL